MWRRLKESEFINKSLSALGDVISALASKTSHIPYRYVSHLPHLRLFIYLFTSYFNLLFDQIRNSKLTHILQSSLGELSLYIML